MDANVVLDDVPTFVRKLGSTNSDLLKRVLTFFKEVTYGPSNMRIQRVLEVGALEHLANLLRRSKNTSVKILICNIVSNMAQGNMTHLQDKLAGGGCLEALLHHLSFSKTVRYEGRIADRDEKTCITGV
ncbi:hypothetical protein OROGR_018926 [Orobanche gracilis]